MKGEEETGDESRSKKEEERERLRVLSVDKVTVEKIVFESSSGSREVLLTKNESSRKLSIKSEVGKTIPTRPGTERKEPKDAKNRSSLPEDILAAKPSAPTGSRIEKRIKPVKLTKSPSIGSVSVPSFVLNGVARASDTSSEAPSKESKLEESKELTEKEDRETDEKDSERKDREENEGVEARDRLEKSRSNIKVLQKNLNTKIDADTVERYAKKLQELRANRALRLPVVVVDSNANEKPLGQVAFDEDFLRRHSLDERLKIEESPESELDRRIEEESDELAARITTKPSYSEQVSEVEKRWSGEFLGNGPGRGSSDESESSYVEEFGGVSSEESVVGDPGATLLFERKENSEESRGSVELTGRQTSEEVLADSTVSTLDSDSCLEDRIGALEEEEEVDNRNEIENDRRRELDARSLTREPTGRLSEATVPSRGEKISSGCSTDSVDSTRSGRDGYASLVRKFAMDSTSVAGSSRTKKEEKQKKKLGLRRLLPGFFSPKDSRKDYKKKKESKERRRHEDRHFARYQQNGNYTRSPDTMNLNEDIKRNVKLDNSLNGSIIEERLDEIKRELFPDQCPITSTPDHLARDEEQDLLRDRAVGARAYAIDSSLSSIAPDDAWNDRSARLGISPDFGKFEQRQKREEFCQKYGPRLERKHSLQESNQPNRACFFQRNHGPSGRISAPPTERFIVRPRAIHPIDRPLPAIPALPRPRIDSSNYENYPEERGQRRPIRYDRTAYTIEEPEYSNESALYENEAPSAGLILKSVSAQVKITRQPIGNQNQKRAPLVGRSAKYLSSGSSQKSGDYGDSSCTPNSSQKSEFSPSSSKSGEYYLNSPRNSGSPNGRDFDEENSPPSREGIYENEKSPSRSSTRCADERIYDETPSSDREAKRPNCSLDNTDSSPSRVCPKDERPTSPRSNADKRSDGEASVSKARGSRIAPPPPQPTSRRSQPNEQILIASPKREVAYETRIPRPVNESGRCAVESPVRLANSPHGLAATNALDARNQDSGSGNREVSGSRAVEYSTGAEIARPEPVYGHRNERNADGSEVSDGAPRTQGPATSPSRSPSNRNEAVAPERNASRTGNSGEPVESSRRGQSQPTVRSPRSIPLLAIDAQRSRNSGQQTAYGIANSGRAEPQRVLQPQPQPQRQRPEPRSRSPASQSVEEAAYLRRIPETTHGQELVVGPPSPSKQETRQRLEAFYWQQKTLEANRKAVAPPTNSTSRQMGRKIDLPEVREAVYWQRLKKLDEEQQRRIYEQNLMEERSYRDTGSKSPAARSTGPRQVPATTAYGEGTPWAGNVARSKPNPTGKPPLMQSQKGQNQPVLIVRPQQAIRERRETIPVKPVDSSAGQETQRSKSASPHFHRGGDSRQIVPRKLDTPSTYEEEATANDDEGKIAPPPIFKRGSLIGGESAEYGSASGAKRVSFSNQSAIGQDLVSGNWPTKRGIAPEPPTRTRRSEDSVSDTDSVFLRRDACPDTEYDADRPLPPLPPPVQDAVSSGNSSGITAPRSNASGDARWNARADPRRAISPHRMLRQKEEEWNSDGKGRQSNDIGGSGRGEGEAGSNEIPGGRRGGGGGGGIGVGGGGSVLGVGGGGGIGGSGGGGSGGRSGSVGGGRSRDEPRRHTLGGDHQPSLHHQQFNAAQQLHPLHPHHLPPPHGQYGTPPTRHTTMDLEMGTKSRQRKSPLPRGYPPPSSTMLLDEDPGIMSEVETSSTGFRRGGKQRSSLPVVRNPSKTLERPLGLVFLQYRNETKRALLPNEITSIDTVKALFVRSFPKQLTMEYLDSPHVKVYIHDSNKDMFYELEDLRSHLRDIRDRSVLRLFESTDGVTGMSGPLGIPGTGAGLPPHWEDQSYFSEPEFDSEYQHQHIHKSKTAKNSSSGSSGYYIGGSSTLPRGGPLMRAYSPAASSVVGGPSSTPTQPKPLATPGGGGVPPAKPLRSYHCGKSPLGSLGGSARFSRDSSVSLYSIADRLHGESGYMSSPERGGGVGSGSGRYPPGPYSAGSSYEDPYYSQYSGTVTPVIDEEASDTELLEESYSLYGVKPPGRPPSGPPRSPFPPGAPPPLPPGGQSYDATRIRVEHMERQLANLTGLVQKALTHAPHTSPSPRDYLQVPAGRDPYARGPVSQPAVTDDSYLRTDVKPPKLGKDKSVSFEKSVSFSDDPPDMNSPKQHSPQHAADTKPTKPAIKSSTLPRMSSQERDRHKPTPPPKPAALVAGQYVYRDLALTPEMYNQLRGLQKKAKDLRQEVRNLRRMSQAQAHTIRETILDTFITIRAMLLSCGDAAWDAEKIRLSREEDFYRQEMLRLVKDLTELENTVEELRGNVINRKTRVNMSDVENMALIMSKSSKTVADLKVRFPSLLECMKGLLSSEMEMVVRAEKFLKEEPERLESVVKRCKKLTSTLVTLKRLASVQEQRLPNAATSVDAEETPPITPTSAQHSKATAPVPAERTVVGSASVIGGGPHALEPPATHQQRPENALDALLDELQTFSRPSSQLGHVAAQTSSRGEAPGAVTTSVGTPARAPCISDIGRKGSVDSSSGTVVALAPAGPPTNTGGTLRRLHSYPSSSDTDTSPPIARLQVSLQDQQPSLPTLPQGFVPGQKPPVPERNAELLQLATARRVPPPPPPRTSSRSPLASPTSPQLPPRNHSCNLQTGNATLRRPPARGTQPIKEGKPPMALPAEAVVPALETGPTLLHNNGSSTSQSSAVLSTSNSSSCESVNSQEGLQSKKGRQEQLEQRHQELLRKQKALQEQYARLQQLQRNTAGLTTVPPAPPDLLKKTGSESNLLAKMGLGLSAASSGSLTSLAAKPITAVSQESSVDGAHRSRPEQSGEQSRSTGPSVNATSATVTATNTVSTASTESNDVDQVSNSSAISNGAAVATASTAAASNCATASTTTTTTTSKIYETDIL
ncbi:uncharacterized protein LOC100883165 isoform X5 [Megachile rotundata]|uniref:uncharacterized protein LOC100883165 isoform X5 n=1 Tax=Megachile rotundata TaxID=143995 RepID=UPI003FCFED05